MSRLAALLALLVSLVVLAGCGGDEDDEPGERIVETARSDGDRIVVESDNGAFSAAAVYERAAPGVVTIRSILPASDDGLGAQGGQGSGFVISDEGEIVTNAHVVTDAQASGGGPINEAREVYVQFPDRNQVEAEIVGVDPFADVALIKVDPEGLDLQPLQFGDITELHVGDPVAAIGSPFGERQSLSTGIVSATDRSIPSLTDFQIDGAIQTDASINPGNSGGPLLDSEARVIGINQQIDTTSGGNQGVGFAVPVDLALRSVEQLREDGETAYAYIGVTTQPLYPQLAERLDIDADAGALIAEVVAGGPADDAGLCCLAEDTEELRFQGQTVDTGGDVVISVDGEEIVNEADLPRIISRLEPGDEVPMEIIRGGEGMEITVTLGERPSEVS